MRPLPPSSWELALFLKFSFFRYNFYTSTCSFFFFFSIYGYEFWQMHMIKFHNRNHPQNSPPFSCHSQALQSLICFMLLQCRHIYRTIRNVAFGVWLLLFSIMHVAYVSIVPFLLFSSIPLCGCTRVNLSIHQLKNIWVFPVFDVYE